MTVISTNAGSDSAMNSLNPTLLNTLAPYVRDGRSPGPGDHWHAHPQCVAGAGPASKWIGVEDDVDLVEIIPGIPPCR